MGLDNAARKAAEENLRKIREGEPDKYAVYLSQIISEKDAPVDIRTLAAVILRRALTNVVKDDKTLWDLTSDMPKEFMKARLLESVQTA